MFVDLPGNDEWTRPHTYHSFEESEGWFERSNYSPTPPNFNITLSSESKPGGEKASVSEGSGIADLRRSHPFDRLQVRI